MKSAPLGVASIVSILATIGLVMGLYSGQPWPSKEAVAHLQNALASEHKDRLEADAERLQDVRQALLQLQGLQLEVRQIRDDLDGIKAYVYPARNSRTRPAP